MLGWRGVDFGRRRGWKGPVRTCLDQGRGGSLWWKRGTLCQSSFGGWGFTGACSIPLRRAAKTLCLAVWSTGPGVRAFLGAVPLVPVRAGHLGSRPRPLR